MKILRVLPLALCLLGISSFAFAQTPLTPEIEVSSAETGFNVSEFDAAMNARGELVVFWSALRPGTLEHALFVRGFAADGTPRTEAILVSEEPATASYLRPAVAIRDDGSFLAVYLQYVPDGASYLEGRLFAPDGTSLGDGLPVTDRTFFPGTISVASREDGGFVVAWNDLGGVAYYRLLSPEGERVGPERELGFGSEVSVAAGPQNEMVVVWENVNRENAALRAVAGQRLRPDGTWRGRKFFVNQQRLHRRAQITLPEVAFDSEGGFLVRWSDRGTRIRRYSRGGAALGPIRRLPSGVASPGIVIDREGNFALASVLSRGAGSVQDLIVRRFHENGAPLGPAVHVSAAGNIWDSEIVGNEAGHLVLLWTRDTQIRAKVFSAE